MKARYFSLLLLPAVLAFCVSCATARPPFASDEDWALKQQLTEKLGDYTRTMTVTVNSGRVYLEGSLPNFDDLQRVLEIVRETDGVREVMDRVDLVEPGRPNGNGDWLRDIWR